MQRRTARGVDDSTQRTLHESTDTTRCLQHAKIKAKHNEESGGEEAFSNCHGPRAVHVHASEVA